MIIKGKKVTLRPIVFADAPRFIQWVNDPEINRLIRGGRKNVTLKEERKWIGGLKKSKTERQFAIDVNGTHIGSTGFRDIDEKNKSAEWGILIGDKQSWGNGYGTEVLELMLRHGFRDLKLERIELYVYDYNTRALSLYKRMGFKKEGIKRKANFYKGVFYDKILMSILREEWKRQN